LRADVARLPFRVVRASLDRGRDGLRAPLIGVILLGAATTLYFLADGLVATLLPMQLLAGPPAVARLADPASRRLVVEGGSALSAVREDHIEKCSLRKLYKGFKMAVDVETRELRRPGFVE